MCQQQQLPPRVVYTPDQVQTTNNPTPDALDSQLLTNRGISLSKAAQSKATRTRTRTKTQIHPPLLTAHTSSTTTPIQHQKTPSKKLHELLTLTARNPRTQQFNDPYQTPTHQNTAPASGPCGARLCTHRRSSPSCSRGSQRPPARARCALRRLRTLAGSRCFSVLLLLSGLVPGWVPG